jgi:hypothetical protein
LKRCMECNENGLIRCSYCCSWMILGDYENGGDGGIDGILLRIFILR